MLHWNLSLYPKPTCQKARLTEKTVHEVASTPGNAVELHKEAHIYQLIIAKSEEAGRKSHCAMHGNSEKGSEQYLSESFNDLDSGLGRASEATSSHLKKHHQAFSNTNQEHPRNADAHNRHFKL